MNAATNQVPVMVPALVAAGRHWNVLLARRRSRAASTGTAGPVSWWHRAGYFLRAIARAGGRGPSRRHGRRAGAERRDSALFMTKFKGAVVVATT